MSLFYAWKYNLQSSNSQSPSAVWGLLGWHFFLLDVLPFVMALAAAGRDLKLLYSSSCGFFCLEYERYVCI